MTEAKLKIQIPASTSNLGAGFDAFGIALNVFNEYKIAFTNNQNEFEFSTNLQKKLFPHNKQNIFYKTLIKVLKKYKSKKIPGIKLELNAQIPHCGGFGSSGTAVLAAVITANKILDNKLSEQEILEEACLVEKHPDNICASMLGGFCISSLNNKKLIYKKINWGLNLDFLMLYPLNFHIETSEARKVLNETYSLEDCVFNLAHASLFSAAVLSKDISLIKEACADRIHQSQRLKLIPGAKDIIKMAYENNAIAAGISGSGASIFVIVNSQSKQNSIKNSAQKIWSKYKLESTNLLCKVSNSGALVY